MQGKGTMVAVRGAISGAVRSAWAFNRPITLAILLHVALIPIVLAATVVDPKVIMGAPGWIKPLKFAISNVVYLATFAWLLTLVRGRRVLVQTAATVTGVGLIVESALILMQVVRGVASHFNAATGFDATVFSIMGLCILVVGIFNLIVAVLLLFQRMENRVLAAGVRLGVIVSLVGMTVGVLMASGPTPEQRAMIERGEQPSMIGAHSVGTADGGPGLPFVGWSTEGGDLRVGHFLEIHGMQALPLLALLLCRPGIRRRYSEGRRVALVWIGAVGYVGLTVILTWQALRGQPVIAPDGLTLGALGLLAAGVGVATSVVLMGSERGEAAMAAA